MFSFDASLTAEELELITYLMFVAGVQSSVWVTRDILAIISLLKLVCHSAQDEEEVFTKEREFLGNYFAFDAWVRNEMFPKYLLLALEHLHIVAH